MTVCACCRRQVLRINCYSRCGPPNGPHKGAPYCLTCEGSTWSGRFQSAQQCEAVYSHVYEVKGCCRCCRTPRFDGSSPAHVYMAESAQRNNRSEQRLSCAGCRTMWPTWNRYYPIKYSIERNGEDLDGQVATDTWPRDQRGGDLLPRSSFRFDWTRVHPRWNKCGVLGCPTGSPSCSFCTAWEPVIRDYACSLCTQQVDREGCTRLLRHIVHISKPRQLGSSVALLHPRGGMAADHIPQRLCDAPTLWCRPQTFDDMERPTTSITLEDERRLPRLCGRKVRNQHSSVVPSSTQESSADARVLATLAVADFAPRRTALCMNACLAPTRVLCPTPVQRGTGGFF